MTTVKTAAVALAPMLSAFHSIGDQALQAVWRVDTDGTLDRLVFDFGRVSLVVVAKENDDSIDISAADTSGLSSAGSVDGGHTEPWNHLVGKSFGWGWVTVNQQGYCDGLLLSFGGIVPQIFLNVIASSIKIRAITASA